MSRVSTLFDHISAITIRTFNPTGVFWNLQPNTRMAPNTAITSNTIAVDFYDLWDWRVHFQNSERWLHSISQHCTRFASQMRVLPLLLSRNASGVRGSAPISRLCAAKRAEHVGFAQQTR
jgi:hypothetical protein